jgi:hypothetical protein
MFYIIDTKPSSVNSAPYEAARQRQTPRRDPHSLPPLPASSEARHDLLFVFLLLSQTTSYVPCHRLRVLGATPWGIQRLQIQRLTYYMTVRDKRTVRGGFNIANNSAQWGNAVAFTNLERVWQRVLIVCIAYLAVYHLFRVFRTREYVNGSILHGK